MPKVPLDLDPRVLAKLRAAANREGVTIDDAANRLLGNALRTPLSSGSLAASIRVRPSAQSYEYEDSHDASTDHDEAEDPEGSEGPETSEAHTLSEALGTTRRASD